MQTAYIQVGEIRETKNQTAGVFVLFLCVVGVPGPSW